MCEYASFVVFGGARGSWFFAGWGRWCCVCTVVLSLLFCQIQGKCLCKHRKVFTLLSSPIRLIKERGRSQKMISASRGILGSLDLWLAAVIDFVHDQTVGPCTYCILIEQYKKKLDALASFGEKSMVLALSINK